MLQLHKIRFRAVIVGTDSRFTVALIEQQLPSKGTSRETLESRSYFRWLLRF